tara:strand:- start:809 stop:1069 length:261 start_codon:yes stop_codon:yes gene_type:complete
MDKKESFGEASSENLKVGDIVEWTRWEPEEQKWASNYGILIEMKNEFRSNRLVSISKVVPLNDSITELEFFTMTLRRISPDEAPKI